MCQPEFIEVIVCGEARRLRVGSTVKDLLRELGVPVAGTAVEVEGAILPPAAHAGTALLSGHRVEIVRLVGGG